MMKYVLDLKVEIQTVNITHHKKERPSTIKEDGHDIL